MRWLLRSEIHNAKVTASNTDGIATNGITIDSHILERSGISHGERVTITCRSTGLTLETYVIEGVLERRGRGEICVNGPCARWFPPGASINITGWELCDNAFYTPIIIVMGEGNKIL